MPPRSEAKGVSFRRPLRDVANNIGAGRFAKSAVNTKKPARRPSSDGGDGDGDALDRLLLIQSDFSAVLRQVDELVVQAFQLNSKGKQEVDSFADVLSEMLSSLKPWVPRFQKVLSCCSSEPENRSRNASVLGKSVSSVVDGIENEAPESPDTPDLDMLVSPSPLVSWRANCTTEGGGRQLFLLTPLPISKGLSSRHQKPPKSVFERVDLEVPRKLFSFNSLSIDTKCDLVQGAETKPALPPKPCELVAASETSTPMMFLKSKGSIVIMTPCLKRSPPKSCVLLEEIAESSSRGRRCEARRSTPFPVGLKFSDSDESESSSGSEASEDLAFKYPELMGIQQARKSVVTKKHVEESPDWFRSPPKSCVLLEPSNEEMLNQVGTFGLQESVDELVESTPPCKEDLQSTRRRGKHPGENTLKKELWAKFEEASYSGLRFSVSVLGEASQKGFLDRLDEASCDGEI